MATTQFPHIEQSGLTEAQVLTRAKKFIIGMYDYTGTEYSLDDAIGYVIDAAIEHNQGVA